MAQRMKRQKSDYGSVYKGHEGQWSWLFHRISGVGIILFLFAHVVDTAVIGWGPTAYNRVLSAYENPYVRMLELGLVAMVVYHSLNGIKLLLIDFFPSLTTRIRGLGLTTAALFVLSMIPISYIMIHQAIDLWQKH